MKKVLVVNPFGIGDVIFSMSLVEAIRESRPEVFIGFLCNERTADLVRLNRSIDRTFVFNRDLFRRFWKKNPILLFKKLKTLLAMLRLEKFDTLIDLSLGREYSFFAVLLGIPVRAGFDFKGRGLFLTHKKKIEAYEKLPVAAIQLGLLEKLGIRHDKNFSRLPIHVSPAAREAVNSFLKKNGITGSESLFAVAPGGGRSWGRDAVFKQWDPERFAEVANRVRPGAAVFVLGDKSERELLDKTAAGIRGRARVIAGEPLERVSAFLLRSDFLLCNDGGLLHLANALGVKTVSIFGPVDEKVYGPTGRETAHEVITEPVPCRPCYQKFRFPPCPYERRCLNLLSVEKVVDAVNKICNVKSMPGLPE